MKLQSVYRCMVCLGVLVLTACAEERDPKTETPVDPQPGRYEITLSGAGLLKIAGKEEAKSYCLKRYDSPSFSHMLAKNYYAFHSSCKTKKSPREGNAVGGEISCLADPKFADGMNRFVYSGAVGSDSTKVEVRMKLDALIKEDSMSEAEAKQLKLGMKAFERMRFVISAQRIGDC